jgi:hypothetical protein
VRLSGVVIEEFVLETEIVSGFLHCGIFEKTGFANGSCTLSVVPAFQAV